MSVRNLNLSAGRLEALAQQHNLFLDLANTQPAEIYRLFVYATKSLDVENWRNAEDLPYIFEFTNSRFCEMLKISKQDIDVISRD